jgi:hypothetical protein
MRTCKGSGEAGDRIGVTGSDSGTANGCHCISREHEEAQQSGSEGFLLSRLFLFCPLSQAKKGDLKEAALL